MSEKVKRRLKIMKHAIMVIGHGDDASILQATITHLDAPNIDFYIHWDKRFEQPTLTATQSDIRFISQQKVRWGTEDLVFVPRALMNAAMNQGQYDYFHLISAVDMPLFSVEYFDEFFNGLDYLGFVGEISQDVQRRLSWFWPVKYFNLQSQVGMKVLKIIKVVNLILHIDRVKGKFPVKKGSNWYSLTRETTKKLIQFPNYRFFKHSYIGDEMFAQTILADEQIRIQSNMTTDVLIDDNFQAARYIDWHRGTPYQFTIEDAAELAGVYNTKFAFARKIKDVATVNAVFEKVKK
ncbi:hypothetical protein CYQ73_14095 [Enterococcus faecium]|uniref:Peptide O-xylosyltransferase n=2 Tax=Enterococcus faecium TaxID=1352 RepID=A0AB37VPQ6_ENTFC|nr:hypothetical protein CYQ86_14000 [Enterococcus faecium]RXU73716.1 hypothetical protein CYQ85_13415 [Enterococcus faecium]RXU82253.1 hypothetical protein CYQ77_14015 [Enterococcus faecium]RXW60393.1 hypothetical protein CYQ73_14095 [Enterococcus faecium]